jgi:hypothetical protein
MILKKQIVRTLVVEIVVDLEKPKNEVVLIIHWAGGHHTELRAPTHWRKRQSNSPDLKSIVNTLRKVLGDEAIASTLNRQRLRTPDGNTWTAEKVADFRENHHIAEYNAELQKARGWMTQAQAATHVDVPDEYDQARSVRHNSCRTAGRRASHSYSTGGPRQLTRPSHALHLQNIPKTPAISPSRPT